MYPFTSKKTSGRRVSLSRRSFIVLYFYINPHTRLELNGEASLKHSDLFDDLSDQRIIEIFKASAQEEAAPVAEAVEKPPVVPRRDRVGKKLPKGSWPSEKRWKDEGGTIIKHPDGSRTYEKMIDSEKVSVKYNINKYPDFTPYAHPTVQPVKIKVAKPTDRKADFRNANNAANLNKKSKPPVPGSNEPPRGYTWHHHEDGETMILVNKEVHADFSHTGGVSTVNRK